MRVMTWNLWWRHGPWEARQAAIESVLRDEAPDVVLLQETWAEEGGARQAEHLADLLGMDAVVGEGPFLAEGVAMVNAVLTRHAVLDAGQVGLPGADGAPGVRHAVAAVLDTPSGPWPVLATHLSYRADESALREAQARVLCETVAALRGDPESDPPVVLGGDLNAPPDSDEIRLLTGRRAAHLPGLVFTDAWEVSGDGPGFTWDASNPYQTDAYWPRRRLDYVLVSWPRPKPLGNPRRAWLAGTTPVDGIVPSDHWAVVVDLADR